MIPLDGVILISPCNSRVPILFAEFSPKWPLGSRSHQLMELMKLYNTLQATVIHPQGRRSRGGGRRPNICSIM